MYWKQRSSTQSRCWNFYDRDSLISQRYRFFFEWDPGWPDSNFYLLEGGLEFGTRTVPVYSGGGRWWSGLWPSCIWTAADRRYFCKFTSAFSSQWWGLPIFRGVGRHFAWIFDLLSIELQGGFSIFTGFPHTSSTLFGTGREFEPQASAIFTAGLDKWGPTTFEGQSGGWM